MWVLEDRATGRRTYCTLNEGLGKVLRYGAYSPDVIDRLRWMGDVLAPLLQKAVRAAGTACATNPLPLVVPCHRVVRSDGTLGGYGGGLEAKQILLMLEAER